MTKDAILQELKGKDLSVLQKLYDYAQLILIPDQDLLVNVTQKQMLDKVFSLADTHFPSWTDRSESDFGRFLAELVCLFSEKDFWYLNQFSNQSLLRKMTVYPEAFTRCVELGYAPTVCNSATAVFLVSFAASATSTVYQPGELIVGFPDIDVKFFNKDSFTVPASGETITKSLILTEGRLYTASMPYNGHAVYIQTPMVDVDSIKVKINNVDWSRVSNFGYSTANDFHFITIPEELGQVSLYFGANGYGKQPVISDNVELSYIISTGKTGNLSKQTTTVVRSYASTRVAKSATMQAASTGGTNPESLDSLKNNALRYNYSKQTAINPAITERIINTYPEVQQSKVSVIGNNVYFRVIPRDGTVATTDLLLSIQERLLPLLVQGYTCLGQQTTYIQSGPVVLTISLLNGYTKESTRAAAQQLVQDYTNPLVLATYGREFDLTELSLLIKSQVPGVQNVIYTTVAGGSPRSISVEESDILSKVALNQITVNVVTV